MAVELREDLGSRHGLDLGLGWWSRCLLASARFLSASLLIGGGVVGVAWFVSFLRVLGSRLIPGAHPPSGRCDLWCGCFEPAPEGLGEGRQRVREGWTGLVSDRVQGWESGRGMETICVGAGPAGLYFGILSKLRDPAGVVTVLERNPRGVTYGWGVVFWDDLMANLHRNDPVSARRIYSAAVQWYDQQVRIGDRPAAHMGGYGYSIGRALLLSILTERAEELGVEVRFDHPVEDVARLRGVDLVVAADGANSRTRELLAERFEPAVEVGRNYYIWLGTHKVFDVFTFGFERTAAGWLWFHGYRFNADTSTIIVECAPATWCGLGLDTLGPDESLQLLRDIFARHLDGHDLIDQRAGPDKTPWLNFTRISNTQWYADNVVLMGDAAHTTDFSIGSGTKLAIEDAIGLDTALRAYPVVPDALVRYQHDRAAAVTIRQRAARSSASWFENVQRHIEADPVRFAYSLRTRRDGAVSRASLSWLLHRATQHAAGRMARRWISAAKRRSSGQLRHR